MEATTAGLGLAWDVSLHGMELRSLPPPALGLFSTG